MKRITSFLALSAIVVAGTFAGTALQASAANVNVNFNVYNADSSASMIRTASAEPSGVTGLINPASAISPGGYDPASGSALFSKLAPGLGLSVGTQFIYASASDLNINQCTFHIQVTHTSQNLYTLHFWVDGSGMNCSVPADVTSTDGNFTSTTYTLNWSR